jgi:1-acyl-sn-glycerol-3-phosphate acyltransferase
LSRFARFNASPLQVGARYSISRSHVPGGSPQPYSRREQDLVFRCLKVIGGIYCRAFHDTRVLRPCEIPAKGPAILVCNHVSSFDPVVLQSYCPRLVRWLMAKEYYQFKSMRWFFDAMGVILVERSGHDLASARAAIRALAAGYVVGIFPEGKIETTRDLLPFQSGIGLLALRSRAPVYPVYLDGTQRGREMVEALVTRSKVCVSFGPRVKLEGLANTREGVHEATKRIEAAVVSLKDSKTPACAGRRFSSPAGPTAEGEAR